jgi:dTDP-4-dehydrorhamnose reductase
VTGASGQLGLEVARLLPEARLHTRERLDVSDGDRVRSVLDGADVVIHLAAFTNVDECEAAEERAFAVNARGTEHVADAAARAAGRVVYVSTDYVFDGTKHGEYGEDDEPNPLNVYGRSKLEGERAVLAREENLVVRTSWVYGQGRNFVATMLRAARAGKRLSVVADQVGRPTWARDLARALVHLVEVGATGTMHVAGDGPSCSWADLADESLAVAGLTARVDRVTTDAYARLAGRTLAARPANSSLSLARARSQGVPLGDWRRSVSAYVREAS